VDFESLLRKALKDPIDVHEALYLLMKASTWDRVLELMRVASRVRDDELGPRVKVMGFVASITPCTVNPWCKYCFRWARRDDLFTHRDVLESYEIVEALKKLRELGVESVELGGGTYTNEVGRFYTLRLIEVLLKEVPNMKLWLNNGPSYRVEDLRIMKCWGLRGVACNFETLDERKYVELRPGLNLRDRIDIVDECDRLGLGIDQTLLIGLGDRNDRNYEEYTWFLHRMLKFKHLEILEIHPFRPVRNSPRQVDRPGSMVETLKVMAVARLMLRRVEISGAHTPQGILAGASLVMHVYPVTRAHRAWGRDPIFYSRIINVVNDVVIVDNFDEYTRAAREMGLSVEPF